LSTAGRDVSSFEIMEGKRARVLGLLDFATVTHLLPLGSAAITAGETSTIDLGGVTGSDSSGLALLIEWLSVARNAQRSVHYENMPAQLHQLARLSEVEELLIAAEPAVAARDTGAETPAT
jgi:phospholipid transport system transporter-binding protein